MSDSDAKNKTAGPGAAPESSNCGTGPAKNAAKGFTECPSLEAWIKNHRDRGKGSKWWRSLPWVGDSQIRNGKWWADIGDEVIARKTLWLTAVSELENQETPVPEARRLAAADVFVEKAQKAITRRAKSYMAAGILMSLATIIGMIYIAVHMYDQLWQGVDRYLDSLQFSLVVVRMITIGGLIAGVGYFLVSISRAFLHEGTALFERRHALRFGRLYVYLFGEDIKFSELEAAFNWNKEIHTAFKDIRADKATRSIAQLVAEAGVEAIKTGASAVKSDGPKRTFRAKL